MVLDVSHPFDAAERLLGHLLLIVRRDNPSEHHPALVVLKPQFLPREVRMLRERGVNQFVENREGRHAKARALEAGGVFGGQASGVGAAARTTASSVK